jgi:hypothetical protein
MTRSLFLFLCLAVGTASGQEISAIQTWGGTVAGRISTSPFNDSKNEGNPRPQRRSIYIQLNANALFASLKDWKNRLYLSDGTHPSSICTVFGGELGAVINDHVQIGTGCELFFTPSVNAVAPSPNLTDQITGSFFYGSLRIGSFPALESTNGLFLFVGGDVGTLHATESLENYYTPNSEITGSTFAYRLKGGAQYYPLDNWSIAVEAGYLAAKITNVTNQPSADYALNFSGFEFRFAVNYHIPL